MMQESTQQNFTFQHDNSSAVTERTIITNLPSESISANRTPNQHQRNRVTRKGAKPRHGHSLKGNQSRTYVSWISMRTRCLNPHAEGYKYYGARGIKICERWNKFENFLADMGERPEGTSIDRLDYNKDYEPGNCKWATDIEQVYNRRATKRITVEGVTKALGQWAHESGVPATTISSRLNRGWNPKHAISQPPSKNFCRPNLTNYRTV